MLFAIDFYFGKTLYYNFFSQYKLFFTEIFCFFGLKFSFISVLAEFLNTHYVFFQFAIGYGTWRFRPG